MLTAASPLHPKARLPPVAGLSPSRQVCYRPGRMSAPGSSQTPPKPTPFTMGSWRKSFGAYWSRANREVINTVIAAYDAAHRKAGLSV